MMFNLSWFHTRRCAADTTVLAPKPRRPNGLAPLMALLWVPLSAALLVACGGGDPTTRVTNAQASNTRYGQTMTLSVSGSGLNAEGLQLVTEGAACTGSKRTSMLEYQGAFTCLIEGTGPLQAVLRNAEGAELARVEAFIAEPRVLMTVTQGTRSGSFILELDPKAAPATVLNFIRYINAGFYTNTIFHRVLAGQLAQGGQFIADLSLRQALYDPIVLESQNGLTNLRGTIAMARSSEPDSASAQFYLNLRDNPAFDFVDESAPGYAVFGRVLSGMDVVDEIGKVAVYTYSNQLPALPQVSVTITLAAQIQ
jgi:peptidyl-prolyl cis-trans isomerase A (cyclophilin A)